MVPIFLLLISRFVLVFWFWFFALSQMMDFVNLLGGRLWEMLCIFKYFINVSREQYP